jgi:16S rRNA (cytosine1402-N4)-methyltransferase
MGIVHTPVLLQEVTDNLVSVGSRLFIDATVGGGGHSYHILEKYPGLKLVGIDVDEDTLKIAEERLRPFQDRVTLLRGNFRELRNLLPEAGIVSFDAILFDLGLSTFQIAANRGFSFRDDAFLDMRMDNRTSLTAYDVVNRYGYKDLLRILREYGEEERAVRIARAITEERKKKPIATADELSGIVIRVKRRTGKINPATKTFQAVRIEVNDELKGIESGISRAVDLLVPGGRIGVISFHSLEDRIVKEFFKGSPHLSVMTRKPLRPGREEIRANARARSAKLRIAEKIDIAKSFTENDE